MSNNKNALSISQETAEPTNNFGSMAMLIHHFWIRRYLFLAIVLLITLTGSVFVFQLIPRYTADNKILVGINKAQVVEIKAVVSNDLYNDSFVKGEVEVLTSRELIKKVIKKLNLLSKVEFNPSLKKEQDEGFLSELNPKQWLSEELKEAIGLTNHQSEPLSEKEQQERLLSTATTIYSSKLKVTPVKGSQVINISFESTDAKLATEIVNTHADSYIVGQLEAKFEATQKATSWLNEQLSQLRDKVEQSEKAVELYRIQHHLSKTEGERTLVGQQLSEINGQLIIAKAQRAEAAARLAQVNQLLNNGTGIETASEILSSPMIQGLRTQEIELTRKLSEMSVEYGARHPKLISLNAELDELRVKIKNEIHKIASGLRNELNIASAREASLESSLRSSESKSGVNRTEEVQLHALEREANANKALFETFLNRFKETSALKDKDIQQADARVISAGEIPTIASFPKTNLFIGVIFFMSILIASAVVLFLEMLHLGVRTPEEIEETFGFPVIGLIPKMPKKVIPFDYILEKPNSNLNESISSLRASLILSDPDHEVKTLIVTSSVPSEGKSMLALSLGRNASTAGQKVLLIDADFRRPTVEKRLGFSEKTKGLTDLIMSHENNIADFMYNDKKTNLFIMPKGQTEYINPMDIFTSHRMESVIAMLKEQFDLVIFDTPPVMAVSDARILGALVDKTVFVIAWDKTPRKTIKASLEQIVKSRANLSGLVLQQVDFQQYSRYSYNESGYYYHYSKYGQYYSD